MWNPKSFTYLNKFQVSEAFTENVDYLRDRELLLSKCQVNDAILMPESRRLVIATSKRDLRFFSISTEHLTEEFCINCLLQPPTCLDYHFDAVTEKSYLVFGDTLGNVHQVKFLKPRDHLHDPIFQTKGVLEIGLSVIIKIN